MVIASGRSRLTTRPTLFIDRFADAIRCTSCAEIGGDAKPFYAHSQLPWGILGILYAVPAEVGTSLPYTIATESM